MHAVVKCNHTFVHCLFLNLTVTDEPLNTWQGLLFPLMNTQKQTNKQKNNEEKNNSKNIRRGTTIIIGERNEMGGESPLLPICKPPMGCS